MQLHTLKCEHMYNHDSPKSFFIAEMNLKPHHYETGLITVSE